MCENIYKHENTGHLSIFSVNKTLSADLMKQR